MFCDQHYGVSDITSKHHQINKKIEWATLQYNMGHTQTQTQTQK